MKAAPFATAAQRARDLLAHTGYRGVIVLAPRAIRVPPQYDVPRSAAAVAAILRTGVEWSRAEGGDFLVTFP